MSKITNYCLTRSGTGLLYSCSHMTTVGVKGLTFCTLYNDFPCLIIIIILTIIIIIIIVIIFTESWLSSQLMKAILCSALNVCEILLVMVVG